MMLLIIQSTNLKTSISGDDVNFPLPVFFFFKLILCQVIHVPLVPNALLTTHRDTCERTKSMHATSVLSPERPKGNVKAASAGQRFPLGKPE